MIEQHATGALRTITIDRPGRRNALTPAGLDALHEAVAEASEPVLYLRGAGRAFCAGADLDELAGFDEAQAVAFAEQGQAVASAIADSRSVVVAGIDGPARGGGVELALACDLRIGTPAATFAEPGVTMGLFGAWGGTVRLPRVVGLGEAMDLALTGRVVDAEEALRMGLLSQVLDSPRTVAETVAGHDPAALSTVVERLRDADAETAQEQREAAAFGRLLAGADLPGIGG